MGDRTYILGLVFDIERLAMQKEVDVFAVQEKAKQLREEIRSAVDVE